MQTRTIPLSLLGLLLGGMAWAQDPAPEPAVPVPAPAPQEGREDEDKDEESPTEEQVQVEHPEEIARIQTSLDRLARVRRELKRGSTEDLRTTGVEFQESERSPRLGERSAVLPLTLREAIRAALANNPDYLVALLDARAAAEGVPQARGAFDPSLSFTGTWGQSRSPFFSANPFSGLPPGLAVARARRMNLGTTINQLLPTGTQLSLSYNEARTKSNNSFKLIVLTDISNDYIAHR